MAAGNVSRRWSTSGQSGSTIGSATYGSLSIRTSDEHTTGINSIESHGKFSSKFGLVLSCLGCVVGTGNIWRFPRVVANNSQDEGGLVFLIVWVFFLLLWSIPMLTLEYGTGRFTQKAVVGSFRQLIGDKTMWMTGWICMVSFLISCYYAVVLGWCFYYLAYSIFNELPTEPEDSRQIFKDFAEESSWPLLTSALAVVLAGLSVAKGVKTIEKVSLFLVPVLLFIIGFTFVWSLTREYADLGITYLFTPNWESFGKPRLWVDALSQNAFDTAAGTGIMIPYSSFMTRNHGVVRYSVIIPTLNNMISLISGMTIFACVFSTLIPLRPYYTKTDIINVLKDSGPGSTGLTFIWLPVLFQSVGVLGRVLACLFFLCLSFAGLTSLISNMELFAHTVADFGVSRKFAVPICIILTFGLGCMSADDIHILTNQDFVWGFGLVINGLMFIGMVTYFGTGRFRQELVNDFGLEDWRLAKTWEWVIKYIAPVEGGVLIVWWAYDLISQGSGDDSGDEWWQFGQETFMVVLVQWLGLLLVLVMVNVLVVHCYINRRGSWTPGEHNNTDTAPLVTDAAFVPPSRKPKPDFIDIEV